MSTGDPICSHCGELWPCSGKAGSAHVTSFTTTISGDMKFDTKQMMRNELSKYMGDEFFAKVFMDCIDMLKAKNSDYTQGDGKRDRIKHFREAANKHDVPMEKIWGIFVDKHWAAVGKYLKSGQTESEPIEGRIHDVINYMVLLLAIIEDRKLRGDLGE